MKRVLWMKTFRDAKRAIWQYISIQFMVALGVAFLIGSYSVYQNLSASYEKSYRSLNFEDFSIRFNSAPSRVALQVAALPGIASVEGRIVEETGLELNRVSSRRMVGRLIGIPLERELRVNRLKLVAGHRPRSGVQEVLVEAGFAQFHGLKPGEAVVVARGRSRLNLTVAGIVQSDEFLYVVRSKQDLIAMPDSFGVLFIDQDILAALFHRAGQINELHCTTDASASLDRILALTLSALRRYEPEDPVIRADQPSYQMLQQDVEGFRLYAVLFPVLFLGAAVVSVYSMMNRVVHSQRPEIGLLRSLGLTRFQVAVHFLSGPLSIGSFGSLAGIVLGIWFGKLLSVYYMSQLQVPFPEVIPRLSVAGFGAAVGIGMCLLAAWTPALAASKVGPAEAMRPIVPSFGRHSLKLDSVFPKLPMIAKIPLRNVFRQPRRTISTLVGVISGMCLMITASGLLDSMHTAIDQLMSAAFGFDLRADFSEYQSKRVLQSVRSWSGVVWAEGVLELPIAFRHGNKTYEARINGIETESRLKPIVDASGKRVLVSEEGAIFGPTLRKRLDLEVGDRIEIQLPEYLTKEGSSRREIAVAGFCEEAIGTQAYMPRWQLETLFRDDLDLPGNAITSVLVKVDPKRSEAVRRNLLELPRNASATTSATMRSMVASLIKSSSRFITIMEAFGIALAFATIFNMITMNILERQSEVATLRTIGVSRWTVGMTIAAENLIVALFGVAIGLPVGRTFVEFFWAAAQTEQQQDLFNFSVSVLPETNVRAALSILVVALVSLLPSLIYLNRLDLARAVKERTN